ncbi:MAG: hypothetical protein CMB34_06610 [Euryarchaeota archaeon]|nr:hypothetical protein [Euryarchaeota archaeon]
MLMYFSRPYSTGFFQTNTSTSFFQTSTIDHISFQRKSRGCCTNVSFDSRNTFLISSGQRRNLLQQYLPTVMGRIINHEFMVDEDRCFGCGACIALCPVHVLTLEDRMIYVDEPNCTHCRLCLPSCPVFALDIVPAVGE